MSDTLDEGQTPAPDSALGRAMQKLANKQGKLSYEEIAAIQPMLDAYLARRDAAGKGWTPPTEQVTPQTIVRFEMPATVQGGSYEINGKGYQGRCEEPFWRYLDLLRAHEQDMYAYYVLREPMGNQPGTRGPWLRTFQPPQIPYTVVKKQEAA